MLDTCTCFVSIYVYNVFNLQVFDLNSYYHTADFYNFYYTFTFENIYILSYIQRN